jgi:hypothetical protein
LVRISAWATQQIQDHFYDLKYKCGVVGKSNVFRVVRWAFYVSLAAMDIKGLHGWGQKMLKPNQLQFLGGFTTEDGRLTWSVSVTFDWNFRGYFGSSIQG